MLKSGRVVRLASMGIGSTEIIIVLVILVIIFGARKLPELGKGIGEGIRNFRKSVKDEPDNDDTPSNKPID